MDVIHYEQKRRVNMLEIGKQMLAESGLNFTTADTMKEAAEKVVALAGRAG